MIIVSTNYEIIMILMEFISYDSISAFHILLAKYRKIVVDLHF